MARKTTTTSSRSTTHSGGHSGAHSTTQKAVATRRVKSLEPRSGKQLTSLEEAVVRMHHGVSVKPSAKLPTNGVNDEVMSQLFEIEVRAHVESGRIDDLPDVPAGRASAQGRQSAKSASNKKTQKVVDKLKTKKKK